MRILGIGEASAYQHQHHLLHVTSARPHRRHGNEMYALAAYGTDKAPFCGEILSCRRRRISALSNSLACDNEMAVSAYRRRGMATRFGAGIRIEILIVMRHHCGINRCGASSKRISAAIENGEIADLSNEAKQYHLYSLKSAPLRLAGARASKSRSVAKRIILAMKLIIGSCAA